jgi:transketolase
LSSIRNLSPAASDDLCINTLRFLSVDMVEKAASGHPGMPMGAATMAYVLWSRFLKHHPANPQWFDRDRFVLSAGHGSALLYSLLHLSGYPLPLSELKRFRSWQSLTPGHPERERTPGVEATTGPLGQGFADGVGMAMAEAHLAARYNRDGLKVIDHYTYGIVSDGDLMEGVASEAASLAGHLKLGKLIYLYDDNRVTLSAGTDITFTEDRAERFAAYGWHTQRVDDGNDAAAIEEALQAAQEEKHRPSLILVRTHIGYGAPDKQDSYKAHGSPLGEDETELAKRNLGWPTEPSFRIPDAVRARFLQATLRGERAEADWNAHMAAYGRVHAELAEELQRRIAGKLPADWDAELSDFPADTKGMATRVAAGKAMVATAHRLPELMGGSADLDPSTHTGLKDLGDFESPGTPAEDREGSQGGGWSYLGRNLHFGVREHAMGGILNGFAAHGGFMPYGSTFLIFSDYMRPPMRLASLMKLHVIYVFTHDSIGLGEDGPTHQPVEQLAGLRAVPGLQVIRPADANETAVAWRLCVEAKDHPVALVLTRQDVPTLDRARYASADGVRRGAYVLAEAPSGKPDVILIASGSEVSLIAAAQEKLRAQGVDARVVSMPCWKIFDAQPEAYRDSVLPPQVRLRLAVEAGAAQGWHRYVGDRGDVLSVDRFGASAPGEVVMREYGFTVENVCKRTLDLLAKHS